MSQLRRIPPGAIAHITDRGNRREPLFRDPADWRLWLRCLTDACARTDVEVLSFCAMTSHTHLLLRSARSQVSEAMWTLKSRFAHDMKVRHDIVGAVFQRRFHSRLVHTDAHFLEVMRYIALNPVRAGLARRPEDHPRSAHAALAGRVTPPPFLAVAAALELVGGRPAYLAAVEDGIAQDARAARAALLDHDSRAPRPALQASAVRRLVLEQGLTVREAAEHLGVARTTAYRALSRG